MFEMFSFVLTSYQDFIEVDEYKIQPSTNSVHRALEGLSCVFLPEGHAQKFKGSESGDDGSLRNVRESVRESDGSHG